MPYALRFCLLLCFLSHTLFGQTTYRYDDTVPLLIAGDTAHMAWLGGLNSPQFNAIDLNDDGDEDLVIFERSTARLLTFVWQEGQYIFDPSYLQVFPSDIEDWLLLRDMDCDGDLDLFQTDNPSSWARVGSDQSEKMINTGAEDLSFGRPGGASTGITRPRSSVSWAQGDITAAVFDFDNDGWPDIYVGATDYPDYRGLLFHQESQLNFQPVAVADGIDHWRCHGIGVADFDRDGDLDILLGHSRNRCGSTGECYETGQVRLFENRLGQDGNWIQLDLEGDEGRTEEIRVRKECRTQWSPNH